MRKFIYLGDNIDLPELNLSKGSVYFGDKVVVILEKYPILTKLLVEVDKLPKFNINEVLLSKYTEELSEILMEGDK